MKSTTVERLVLIALGGLYIFWAVAFIAQNSYMAIDGQRYYGLFDDAMISMRYGWNFAHGSGLVWNAGERVEGYSNLLMTLMMALASLLFDKRMAVLAVQIIGIPTMLCTAWLARSVANSIAEGTKSAALVGILSFAGVLVYFPISYWTLLGMETGVLTMLLLACTVLSLHWLQVGRQRDLVLMGVAGGLAFLTRNDAVLLVGVLLCFLASLSWLRNHRLGDLRQVALAGAIVGVFIVGQTAFRYAYYGELLPNTYLLKLTRYPLNVRLIDGTRFVLEFLAQTWMLFVLAIAALWRRLRPAPVLSLTLVLVVLAYQVYVGGDPWVTWRMLVPGMPFLIALAATGAAALAGNFPRLAAPRRAATATAGLALVAILVANLPFLSDWTLRGPTSAAIANRTNTNSALAITALTQPRASIGVIWAGTLPYYTDRYAVDYLGKSDPYIARLKADVSGSSGWRHQISIPGHNKYDLEYSIVQRKPTYSQAFAWGYATVRPYFVENYVRVEYHGAAGTKTIFLLKDSPLVCWDACSDQYKIIPWPK